MGSKKLDLSKVEFYKLYIFISMERAISRFSCFPFYAIIIQRRMHSVCAGREALAVAYLPQSRYASIKYANAFDMCCRTRYAHCVSADLYHIEFERSENISNLLQGKYIEPSEATVYRQNQNSFCGHRSSACQEKRTRNFRNFSSFSCR